MALDHQKISGLVFGEKRVNNTTYSSYAGFTFIELVIVIALLALLASIGIPPMLRMTPEYRRTEFVRRLNALLDGALSHAISAATVTQIVCDFQKKQIQLWADTGRKTAQGAPVYAPLELPYIETVYDIPAGLEFKNFYINGSDEMHKKGRQTTEQVWFFIMPDGIAQEVIINIKDTNDIERFAEGESLSLVLNPFTVRFAEYETFQKP